VVTLADTLPRYSLAPPEGIEEGKKSSENIHNAELLREVGMTSQDAIKVLSMLQKSARISVEERMQLTQQILSPTLEICSPILTVMSALCDDQDDLVAQLRLLFINTKSE
jgi:hypothetical protein